MATRTSSDDGPISSNELLEAARNYSKAVALARESSRQTLFPGEAKAFARSGIDPEEALGYLSNWLNAHQASLTAEDPTSTLEDRQGSAPAGSTPPHESRARRDLALLRRSLKVTSGEIAVLAGKDPSAVTHWRKGQKKFPEPVVGGRSPLFNFDEVHDWLERHDKLVNEPDAAWLWRKSVQALHQATGQEGRSRLRGYVTAMVVVLPDFLDDISGFVELRETAGFKHWREETDWVLDDDQAEFLCEHLIGVDTDHEARACTARAFRYAIDSECTQRGLLDDALDALDALSPAQTTTSLGVSALITRLAYDLPSPPESVLDLACGEATILADLLNPPPNLKPRHSFKLRGIEKDPDTAAIARIRLQLHDSQGEVDWGIRVDDSLAAATPTEAFDVVVVDPPTKKAKEWVNLAKKSLAANRTSRAFVLLPRSALDADGPCASLIRERQLEAAVFLPNRLKKNSRGLALCVITSGSVPCEEILVIDLADLKLKNLNSGTVTPLSDPPGDAPPIDYALPIDQVCDAISHWRDTRTINRDLLRGRQESITADNAIKRGLGSYSRLLSGDSHANSHRHGTARRSLLSGADLYPIEPLGDGGFSVTATREVPEGAVLTISVAYYIDGGNPIKHWQPADFRLDYMTVEIEGGQLVEKSGNKIQARSTGNEGLKVKVQGFDPNRDLFVAASLSEDN